MKNILKKAGAALLALAMIAAVLTACGKGADDKTIAAKDRLPHR